MGNLGGLQDIQAQLGFWKAQPAQAIEKIVQTVARRHPAGFKNELLVSHACRQLGLGHKHFGRLHTM
jgi:hypothetical protein